MDITNMRVLVVGSGGREHALCWKLFQSKLLSKLWCAPGNPGTEGLAENVNISGLNISHLVEFAVMNRVDLVIPGPETSIVNGLADRLAEYGIPCCAPSKLAAQLENSKVFTKKLCKDVKIPTAKWKASDDLNEALNYNNTLFEFSNAPIVIKADGLAAGKGVVIAKTEEEGVKTINDMMGWRIFGDAGKTIIFEEL